MRRWPLLLLLLLALPARADMFPDASNAKLPDAGRNLGGPFFVKPGGAIQAGLDAAAANGGGVVFVQKGTYTLTTGLLMASNTRLQCEPGAVLVGGWVKPDGAAGSSLIGLKERALITNVNYAAQTRNDTNLTVEGCTFDTAANKQNAVAFRQATHIRVINNRMDSAGGGLTAILASDDVVVAYNRGWAAGTCIDQWEAPTKVRVLYNDCRITNAPGGQNIGILITGGDSGSTMIGSIAGTTLTVDSISVGFPVLGAIVTGTGVAADTRITGVLTGTYGGPGTYSLSKAQTVAATTLKTSTDGMASKGEITGNVIATPDGAGIWVNGLQAPGSGASDIKITGNHIDAASAVACIKLSGAGFGNTIADNTCESPPAQGAIYEGSLGDTGGAPTGTVVRGNIVRNASGTPYGAQGTNSQFSGNYASGTYNYLIDLAGSHNVTVDNNITASTPIVAKYNLGAATDNPIVRDRIATLTANNSVTLDLTGIVTYRQIRIACTGIVPSVYGASLTLQYGTGTPPTFVTSGYGYTLQSSGTFSAGVTTVQTQAGSNILLSTPMHNNNAYGGDFALVIGQDWAVGTTHAAWDGTFSQDGVRYRVSGAGDSNTLTRVTTLRLATTTGNITSGTCVVEGR